MYRMLLALSLALAAAGTQAAEVPAAESGDPGCLKQDLDAAKSATADEASAAASRPGAPSPVRPRADSRSTPRWQSLLPGMFR